MAHSVITSKGQITIPISVRNKLNLKTGDVVDFEIDDGKVNLVPVSKSVDEVFGTLSRENQRAYSVEQLNERLKKRMRDKRK